MTIDFEGKLARLAKEHLARSKYTRESAQGASIQLYQLTDDQTVNTAARRALINVSSNDYLGLADHPILRRAATEAIERYGNGAGASRLLTGNYTLLDELEAATAEWLGYDEALWFASGYLANTGVVPAIATQEDHIFSDQYNHASTIDGCRLSKANLHIFPHRDMNALKRQLEDCPKSGHKIILSETVFSMDGDVADVVTLRALADRFGAFLMLDEAHALGCYGPRGTGIARAHGVTADAIIGTYGKALGSQGAFVAASRACIAWLWNRARTHVFVTAPHPAVVGTALAAVTLASSAEGDMRRAVLAQHVRLFGGASAIIPWIIGDEAATLAMTERLSAAGYWAQGVRPPTVPKGTSRLRMVVSAAHTQAQLSELLVLCQAHGFSHRAAG